MRVMTADPGPVEDVAIGDAFQIFRQLRMQFGARGKGQALVGHFVCDDVLEQVGCLGFVLRVACWYADAYRGSDT